MNTIFDPILNLPPYLATRRNHALEHATLKILARKYDEKNLGGHSNPTGFFLFGDLAMDDIRNAIAEAMSRLRAGEKELAIHPGCGTNAATSLILPATFAFLPMQRARSNLWRFLLIPFALGLAVFGYLLSKPLGPWLQRNVTTEANLGDLQVMEIVSVRKGVHRIVTK
ncbi:MAG TPA: DUF6391 domain-containing protein [Anaerolineales bacterium]|nr:DUF6391 domain-containing protein [Anaerolineales bacterium]